MRTEDQLTTLSEEIVLGIARVVEVHKGMLNSDPAPKTVSLVVKLRGSHVIDVIVRPEWRR